MKKFLFPILIVTILFACSDNSSTQSSVVESNNTKEVKETTKPSELNQNSQKDIPSLALSDSVANENLNTESNESELVFYIDLDGSKFDIVTNEKLNSYYRLDFSGENQYGIRKDSTEEVLPIIWDKIYNPNSVILGCFEIKKDGKIGLFNYKTLEVLQPEYDFIAPYPHEYKEIAYGYKDGLWYEINANGFSEDEKRVDIDVAKVFGSLGFDITNNELMLHPSLNSQLFSQYHNAIGDVDEESLTRKSKTFIFPSYAEYLKIIPYEYVSDIIVDNTSDYHFDGLTTDISLELREVSLSNKIIAFFVEFYESGIGVRGEEATNQQQLLVLKPEEKLFNTKELTTEYEGQRTCDFGNTRVVNDSIIEVDNYYSNYPNKSSLYDWENNYSYFKVSKSGEIISLSSNRHFDYTKFIYINEDYFKGCFANFIDGANIDEREENLVSYEHLSIRDLDIMRNEIFAEYGYKFKSEEWTNYFSQKPWYNPIYDDVNDQLTKIDKANIKVILKVKEAMKGREKEFTKESKSFYVAAG